MAKEKKDEQDGQGDLQEMWEHSDVPGRVSHRSAEAGLPVRGVRGGGGGESGDEQEHARRGEANPHGRPAAVAKPRRQEYSKCDICGMRFKIDGRGERWKNRCGECASKMRKAFITCPICGGKFQYSHMKLVTIHVQPGKKGGRKFKLRYCMTCLAKVQSSTVKLVDQQDRDWKKAAASQREEMFYLRTRRPFT